MIRTVGILALAVIASATCSARASAPDPGTDGRFTLTHDGRERAYILRAPERYPAGRPLPLVLVLHGGGGNGRNAEEMTGFTDLARQRGFLVAYPEGTSRGRLPMLTWNAGHCCGYAMQAEVDDAGFLGAVIDDIGTRHPVDAARIYVTGMSNGAMMAHRAGIELADRIAAIAPVVGGVFGDEADPRSRVSALMINGMLDRSVPYDGGEPGGPFAGSWDGSHIRPALDQARFWARVNGCRDPVATEHEDRSHVRYHCPAGIAVELYGLRDNGHAWPGGQRGSRLGDMPTRSLDATTVIWEFFVAHPRN